MNFDRIKIGGFRNISDVNVELDNIVSLLSINSYGKSNCLNGIIFGIDFIHATLDIKSTMMNYDSYKPFNSKIAYKDFSFEIELTYPNSKEFNKIIYGYTFSWQKDEKTPPKVLDEYLKIKDIQSQKYTSYINRKEEKAFYKPSITSGCIKKINIGDNELLINKLMAYDELYYIELIRKINNISVYVDRNFNTNNSYNIQPILNKRFSDYSLRENTNVPRILFKIKNDFPDKFDLIVNTLKDIFPFIKDINIIEYNIKNNSLINELKNEDFIAANNVYFLVAIDKNLIQPIEFSDMSDGVRRVLLIFITLVLADINNYSLVAIEEPENSLNPKILQRYLMTLNSFANKTKIIITSHSPHLINYLNPKNIYIGLPNDEGIANFSRIKEKSINKLLIDAKNMDMLVGDYLFDLMSGDDTDLETITKYVE